MSQSAPAERYTESDQRSSVKLARIPTAPTAKSRIEYERAAYRRVFARSVHTALAINIDPGAIMGE